MTTAMVPTVYTSPEYVSVTDTAKLLRAALGKAFPGVTFSVRSRKYSGGASIDVGWTDGPPARRVRPLAQRYGGSGFDGMIDLKYSYSSWLSPDGTVTCAGTRGTGGSGGSVPAFEVEKPDPDARLVRFSANYVFERRNLSGEDARVAEAEALVLKSCAGITGTGVGARFGDQYVTSLAQNIAFDVDLTDATDTLERAFRRVVMRETEAEQAACAECVPVLSKVGCGKPTRVIGTSGGTVPCGGLLRGSDGAEAPYLCSRCVPKGAGR